MGWWVAVRWVAALVGSGGWHLGGLWAGGLGLVVCRLDGGPLAVLTCQRPVHRRVGCSAPARRQHPPPPRILWFGGLAASGGLTGRVVGLYGIPGCWWAVWWWAARWVVDFGWYVCNLGGQQGEESSPTRGRAPSQQNPPPALHNPTVRGQVPEPYGDPQRRRAHDDLSGWPGTRPATNPAESMARTPLRRRARSHYNIFQKECMTGCANIGESRCTLRWAIYCNRHVVKTTMKARFCCVRADPVGGVKSCRDVCGGVFGRKYPAAIRQTRAILPHYFIVFIIVIVDSTIITSGYLKQQ